MRENLYKLNLGRRNCEHRSSVPNDLRAQQSPQIIATIYDQSNETLTTPDDEREMSSISNLIAARITLGRRFGLIRRTCEHIRSRCCKHCNRRQRDHHREKLRFHNSLHFISYQMQVCVHVCIIIYD
jgi:hypothetical protein